MPEGEINWNTRLAVKFMSADGSPEIITPIDNFRPNMDLPQDVIDSIDADNLGYSSGNRRFTFDFEVKAVNVSIMRKIYAAAIKCDTFALGIAVKTGESDDWTFDSMKYVDCKITSVTPSEVDNSGGVPTMKFSGKALKVIASNGGQDLTTTTTGATGNLS